MRSASLEVAAAAAAVMHAYRILSVKPVVGHSHAQVPEQRCGCGGGGQAHRGAKPVPAARLLRH